MLLHVHPQKYPLLLYLHQKDEHWIWLFLENFPIWNPFTLLGNTFTMSRLFLLSPYISPTSSCQSSTPYWSTLEYRVTFSGLEVCQILCKQGKGLGQKEETRLISIVSKHDNMYKIRLSLVLLFCCFVVWFCCFIIFFYCFFRTWKLPYPGNIQATTARKMRDELDHPLA